MLTTVFLSILGEEASAKTCDAFRGAVAYGLDTEATAIRAAGPSAQSLPSHPAGRAPTASEGRLDVEKQLVTIDVSLQSFVRQDDGSLRLKGEDARKRAIQAIAPPGYCSALSPWGRHIAGVHAGLAAFLNPDGLDRVQMEKLRLTGAPFVTGKGDVILQPVVRVEFPAQPSAAPLAQAPISAPTGGAGPTGVKAPFQTQADTSVGVTRVRAAEARAAAPTSAGMGEPYSRERMAMAPERLFRLILTVMGVMLLISFLVVGVALRRDQKWEVAKLMEEDGKPSLSRSLALLGAPILLAGFLGFMVAAIAAVVEGRSLPDASAYLLAGATLFLPYLANQGRAAIERGFGNTRG